MFEFWQIALLFGTGVLAGFVDSIAGGGGLITLPVLMHFVPPHLALGTNKLQACFGSGSAAFHYAKAGLVDVKDCGFGFLLSFLGSSAGTLLVLRINPEFLRRFIPILLVLVAVYLLLKPHTGATETKPRMTRTRCDVVFGLAIGFYDGFFGPGTGTFWTMAFMLALGFNMTKATAHTKVMNFASNLASLTFFLAYGSIDFTAGLLMGVGQLIGARIGSRMVVMRGTKFIRPIFLTVVLAITARLLWDAFLRE